MMSAIQSLQNIENARMKLILQAVITQDKAAIEQVATALGVEATQTEFLVIAECANRWLRAQEEGSAPPA